MSTIPPSEESTGCRHGIPMLDQDHAAVFRGYMAIMDKYHSDLNGTELSRQVTTEATDDIMEQYWSEPNHARHIDAEMVRCSYGCAAAEALGGNMALSRRISFLGSYLATWFKLGKDTFIKEFNCVDAERELYSIDAESPNSQTIVDCQASMKKIRTDRGLVLFLAKQIPCSCLDEDKKNAKQSPKTGSCTNCGNEDLKMELMKCSQCKMAEYCSKECQVADWRAGHKKECKEIKQRHDEMAAWKAQLRR
jgi:hypothetical protein